MKKPLAIAAMTALLAGLVIAASPSAYSGPSVKYTFEKDGQPCAQGWKAVEFSPEPTPTSKWHIQSPGDASAQAFYNGPPYAGGDSIELLTSPMHRWRGGKVTLKYAVNYNYEPEATRAVEEGIHVEWSRNNRTWKRLAFHGETNTGYPAFEHHTKKFKVRRGKLWIRFRAISDALVQSNGGAVDNVTLTVKKPKAYSKCAVS